MDLNHLYLDIGHSNKNQAAKEKDKQFTDEHNKHQSPQQPEWLLILEVTTGFLILVFIITGIATTVRTCNLKNSEKIHWKKIMSWKDEMTLSIGSLRIPDLIVFLKIFNNC